MTPLDIHGAVDASGDRIELSVADRIVTTTARSDRRFDATGLVVLPGLIDIQTNGGIGHDFTMDPSSIWDVGAILRTDRLWRGGRDSNPQLLA